ncbi:CDP-glucose 4,6-dehydratase [Candidatus Pelagibacter sp.]|nr:CDP-glucose 4,6-dehydratase [Candidatus Pelagibacter sp.]
MKDLKIFNNKKILITGHNGFKGSWLTIWLNLLGAKVVGVSLVEKNKNNHYNLVKKKLNIKSFFFDIRNKKKLENLILKEKPDFFFHLAAQSLVYRSILNPFFNWETNVMGMLNVLEALNKLKNKCTAVIITSDKCYKNFEQKKGYKETDTLGGVDPYSASKASAEILFNSYFKTFIENKNTKLRVCTARAGNVIGGGDWSNNRLIPDCMKMWLNNKIPEIRNPNSTRPWQHVLEALSGYLDLAIKLNNDSNINGQSFNFSSDKIKNVTVLQFLKKIKMKWPEIIWSLKKNNKFYESSLLQLDTSKVKKILRWKARLNLDETIEFVVDWYKNFQKNKKNTIEVSRNQIIKFMKKKP